MSNAYSPAAIKAAAAVVGERLRQEQRFRADQTEEVKLELRLPDLHPAQSAIVRSAARFNVLACGRRWGKTRLGEDRLMRTASEGFPVAWFSPTYKMLAEVQRDFEREMQPHLSRSNRQEHRFELLSGGVIEMWSLDNPDVARGRKYRRIVIDEAAMVRGLQTAWQEVLRPTLIDFQGDAWFMSTPKGMNFFKTLYDYGQDPQNAEWASWRQPTRMNPYIAEGELVAMKYGTPERTYRQEIEAEFLEFEGAVFRRLQQAATAVEQERDQRGQLYVYGVDWGQVDDFTVITVIDPTTRAMVAFDRFNQIDYVMQTERLKAMFGRFPPALAVVEYNSMGRPIVQRLQLEGFPIFAFETTNATKEYVIQQLALAFERGQIGILNDPVLLGELQAFEAKKLPSGRLSYSAPEGVHDDCVMSLALAYTALDEDAPTNQTVVYEDRVRISPF